MNAHQFEKHENCMIVSCFICDGGLAVCTVCHQAEGDLEDECPGPPLPPCPKCQASLTGWCAEHVIYAGMAGK